MDNEFVINIIAGSFGVGLIFILGICIGSILQKQRQKGEIFDLIGQLIKNWTESMGTLDEYDVDTLIHDFVGDLGRLMDAIYNGTKKEDM